MIYSLKKINTDFNDINYFILTIESGCYIKGQPEILYYLINFILSKNTDRYIRIIEVPKELSTQTYRDLIDDMIGINKEQFHFCI